MSDSIIERELTQGVVPIGTPKAYQYDTAYVESAKASVKQGLAEANTILFAIRNEYGYPFTASTAEAMTDHTKIYVYTGTTTSSLTQGHWYYYNGSAWTDGGNYNSYALETDLTLSISGAAADAHVVGAKLNSFTEPTANLIDASLIISPGYYNSDGTVSTGTPTSMYFPQLIPVEGGETYIWTGVAASKQVLTFDSSGTLIERVQVSSGTDYYQVGSTVRFIKISFYGKDTLPANFMLVKGSTLPSEYIPYGLRVKYDSIADNPVPQLQKTINEITVPSPNLIDESSYVSPGYFNSNGTIDTGTSTSSYYANYIPVETGKTYTWTKWNSNYIIATYDSDKNFIARINKTGDENSYTQSGSVAYIRISFYWGQATMVDDFVLAESDTEPRYVPSGSLIPYERITNIPPLPIASKSKKLQYIASPSLSNAIEELDVYIPATIGYIKYRFVHNYVPAIKCDVWRIEDAIAVAENLTDRFALTTPGEWECAVQIENGIDFSGGRAHGDEVYTDIKFFINGELVDITEYTTVTDFDSLIATQVSNLYNPNDEDVVIAEHTSEHIFDRNLVINQTLNWKAVVKLVHAFLAMLCASQAVTDKYYYDGDFTSVDLSGLSLFDYTHENASSVTEYGATSGVTEKMTVSNMNHDFTNGFLRVTDNNGSSGYNKAYLPFQTHPKGDQTVAVGDVWKQTTEYEFMVAK